MRALSAAHIPCVVLYTMICYRKEKKKAKESQTIRSIQTMKVHPNKSLVNSNYLKVKNHEIHLANRASGRVTIPLTAEYQRLFSRILNVMGPWVAAAIRHLRRNSDCTSLT